MRNGASKKAHRSARNTVRKACPLLFVSLAAAPDYNRGISVFHCFFRIGVETHGWPFSTSNMSHIIFALWAAGSCGRLFRVRAKNTTTPALDFDCWSPAYQHSRCTDTSSRLVLKRCVPRPTSGRPVADRVRGASQPLESQPIMRETDISFIPMSSMSSMSFIPHS